MEKITKRDFLELYNNKKLKLVYGGYYGKKEEVMKQLKGISKKTLEDISVNTSKCNIWNNGRSGISIDIYKENYLIFVEDTINHDLEKSSFTGLDYYTSIYILI